MKNQGWIKLHRKIIDSAVFVHDGMFKLFCLCLMKANHHKAEVIIPGLLKPVLVKPGQFITGRNSLWEAYHQAHLRKNSRRKPAPSAKTVFRWLSILQNRSILSIKSYSKYSIITVLNWKQYQQTVQQVSIKCPSSVHKQEGIRSIYTGEFFSVSEKQHEKYKKAYLRVDLIKQYEKMSAWLESNPKKRKSEKGYPRFINSWLARADAKAAKGDSKDWRDNLKPI